MNYNDGFKYRWNIFDITKVWPQADYPLIPVGKLVLNRNPENYFAETEQVAFAPSHLVPGIEPSLDKMLQGRLFSYPDTHRHRLGVNYKQIPINCPYRAKISNNQRDGFMQVNGNGGSRPNHEPSSFHKYEVVPSAKTSQFRVTGQIGRFKPAHPNDDFAQPGVLYRKVFCDKAKSNIVENLSGALTGVNRDIQERQLKIFYKCDPDYGSRIAKNLGHPVQKSHI
jgi:catalase